MKLTAAPMRDVFTVEMGRIYIEYPSVLTEGDFEDLCEFLEIWKRCRRRSVISPTEPSPDEATGCADDAIPRPVVNAIRKHLEDEFGCLAHSVKRCPECSPERTISATQEGKEECEKLR